jgi:hypothetical protein
MSKLTTTYLTERAMAAIRGTCLDTRPDPDGIKRFQVPIEDKGSGRARLDRRDATAFINEMAPRYVACLVKVTKDAFHFTVRAA